MKKAGFGNKTRVNESIRISTVRLIAEDGEQLGVLDTEDALAKAREQSLDLVEVAPLADPPVCKIMDYGKFLYQEKKKAHEARKHQKTIQIKEVKFRPKIDEHDYNFKKKNILRFLEAGHHVKVVIMYRGREIVHKEYGTHILDRIIEELTDIAKIERGSMMEGRTQTLVLSPLQR